jgi:type IV secretory pathway TraG/TraD family ATPase VirD4
MDRVAAGLPGSILAALVRVLRLPIHRPPTFFWWWFTCDAYAHDIFLEGGFIAASRGVAARAIAVTVSVRRAREVTIHGSVRRAKKREIQRASLPKRTAREHGGRPGTPRSPRK